MTNGKAVPTLFKGAMWGVAAAAFHSLVPVAVRLLSGSMPAIEIVFLRNLIGLVILSVYFAWRGFGLLRTDKIRLHAQRSVLNFAGMWLWFTAIALMPLGQAIALHFTVPLMAVLLAVLILGERPGVRRWTGTFIGFCGVLVILRPGMVEIGWPAMMVLGSALSYAGAVIYTRVLGRTDDPAVTTFYYQLMLTVLAMGPALFVWQPPGWHDFPGLTLIAIAGTAAPYCLIRAYSIAEASAVAPVDFLRLPFTVFAAFLVFGETTDGWTWIGALIVFTSTTYIARREARTPRGGRS